MENMDNINVTKKDFETYVLVQQSGLTNMWDVARVIEIAEISVSDSELDEDKCLAIMRNYKALALRYGEK